MRIFTTVALCGALAAPAHAQEVEEGFDLMEKGVEMLLRGLMDEIEPSMNDMQALVEEFGPILEQFSAEMAPLMQELANLVDDFKHYGQPEFLPNGDIIIRRNPDAPEYEPKVDEDTGEVEL